MALSKKVRDLLDQIVPKERKASVDYGTQFAAKLAAERTPLSPGPGEKLVIKNGKWALETIEPERFAKTAKPEPTPSTPIQKALTARGATMHIKTVGGQGNLRRGMDILAKRADMPLISTDEMQGKTPLVAPAGRPRSQPGLSDADLAVLENGIVADSKVLSLQEAQKLFMANYEVTRRNPGRRLTTQSAGFGVPFSPTQARR